MLPGPVRPAFTSNGRRCAVDVKLKQSNRTLSVIKYLHTQRSPELAAEWGQHLHAKVAVGFNCFKGVSINQLNGFERSTIASQCV